MEARRIKSELKTNHLLVSREISNLIEAYRPGEETGLSFEKDDKRLPDFLRRLGAQVWLTDSGASLRFPSVPYRCYARVVLKKEAQPHDDRAQIAPEIWWSQE